MLGLKKHIYNPIRDVIKKIKEHLFGIETFIKLKEYKKSRNEIYNGEKNILLVGSGKSALEYKKHNLKNVDVLAVNNSIKAFDDLVVDYYLCATDFPKNEIPKKNFYKEKISKYNFRYHTLAFAKYCNLPFRPLVGKTIFLDSLNWAFTKGYKKIYLLGFDHDYNPNRVKKWNGKYETDNKKLEKIFKGKGFEPDTFYGQGTPDPLRFGIEKLSNLFSLVEAHGKFYGCEICNLSSNKKGLTNFRRVIKID
jgi:hypothetical protein